LKYLTQIGSGNPTSPGEFGLQVRLLILLRLFPAKDKCSVFVPLASAVHCYWKPKGRVMSLMAVTPTCVVEASNTIKGPMTHGKQFQAERGSADLLCSHQKDGLSEQARPS